MGRESPGRDGAATRCTLCVKNKFSSAFVAAMACPFLVCNNFLFTVSCSRPCMCVRQWTCVGGMVSGCVDVWMCGCVCDCVCGGWLLSGTCTCNAWLLTQHTQPTRQPKTLQSQSQQQALSRLCRDVCAALELLFKND